jgi:hypothetical protein
MGMERLVQGEPPSLAELVAKVKDIGMVVMVDNQFMAPGAPLPARWHDVRVKTPAGTVTIVRREHAVAVVVWGNAGDALKDAQDKIADALGGWWSAG